ncbi:MAG: branched-chain amino acid transport system substrate-binding protein, partial [Acidimicrobiia bacterium]|nr:branched-chain amino acid transport system substrate-binding protein [Acidimicrobiia bacterium]
MKRSRLNVRLAGLLVLALIAISCGSSGKSSSSATSTSAGSTTSTTTGASTSTTVGAAPTSMDEWEALWTKQRAAIVQRIKANKWGKSADGKTLTGPNGFTVDLSKCPASWSDTEGISETTIKLGHAIAQSGTIANTLYYGKGQETIMAYYADKGAYKDVNGKTRKVDYIQKDDGYDPARTIPLVDEMIDSQKVAAVITTGSPNTLKTYDKLNQRCIPHFLNLTGHPAWGDPANHPWTTGLGLAYTTEAVLWGAFIDNHLAEFASGKVTVSALVENNEFGHIYDAGFKAYLDQSTNKAKINYVSEAVDPQAPTITDQMTTLSSKNPDFFIDMVAGTFCTQAVVEAAQNGMHGKVKYMWQPNTCAGATSLSKAKVGGDGTSSQGWWIVNGGNKDIQDPAQQSDPVVKWARDMLSARGIDPSVETNLGLGMIYGWAWTQIFQIAGQLDG